MFSYRNVFKLRDRILINYDEMFMISFDYMAFIKNHDSLFIDNLI